MTNPNPKLAYTMPETFDELHTSRATGYKELINPGKLKTYKIGRRRYCSRDAIIECQRLLEKECEEGA